MDPRQPSQHPFARNTASPYGRAPFPPSASQSSFPPASHPPNAPSFADHQRRPSDPPYYNPARSYGQEGSPLGPGHARHQSTSSIGQGTPVNRGMPPPSSPQQQAPPQSHHSYVPPPPRPPPVSVGPPSAFPSIRDLPPPNRIQSNGGSSMSISSMLGGPTREPASQYASPIVTSAPSSATYSSHQSPRTATSTADYAPFRRPQTPEHQRSYDARDRANSAGSPPGVGHYSTPDGRRFSGHPYTSRPTPGMSPVDERRDQAARIQNAPPPRPNSQPNAYNAPLSRVPDRASIQTESPFARRPDQYPRSAEPHRGGEYPRPAYEEWHGNAPNHYDRDRQEREALIQRERELRDRDLRERDRERDLREKELRDREREREQQRERMIMNERATTNHGEYAHQVGQRTAPSIYNRPPEPREQPPWQRSGHETSHRVFDHFSTDRAQPHQTPTTNAYEHPGTSAPQYASHSTYAPNESRYSSTSHPSSIPPQHSSIPTSHYEASVQDRQRLAQHQAQQLQLQQQQQQQPVYSGPSPSGPYQPQESPMRPLAEESQQMQQQRSFLGVEINRKGRLSPLPQAVQGAQGQIGGPAGEPGIKSEFGRMFSGIGSGVGSGLNVPSPVSAGPQQPVPFSNSGQRREDPEALSTLNSPLDSNGHQMGRPSSRGRRRKVKEEDSRGDDESSNGRNTPSGRGKRAKMSHHPHYRYHHRPDGPDQASSPSQSTLTPFKSVKGSNTLPSPLGEDDSASLHHHHISRHHHHATPKPAQQNPIHPPFKTIVKSEEVLDSVKNFPRSHLGHGYYTVDLREIGRRRNTRQSPRGWVSTPRPIPKFRGKENCTYTIKVDRVHLTPESREEITVRKSVWGTDIYSDDSDIIAACIHQGWFRGEWNKDVDVSLLGLELEGEINGVANGEHGPKDFLAAPPPKGPMHVPKDRDLDVNILILPTLIKYTPSTRFGLASRLWEDHDGMSFMIQSIRWIESVNTLRPTTGAGRRASMDQHLRERLATINGFTPSNDVTMEESFERGGNPLPGLENGDIKAVGTKSWWKGGRGLRDKEKRTKKEKEDDPQIPPPPTEMGKVPDDIMDSNRDRPMNGATDNADQAIEEDRSLSIEKLADAAIANGGVPTTSHIDRNRSSTVNGEESGISTVPVVQAEIVSTQETPAETSTEIPQPETENTPRQQSEPAPESDETAAAAALGSLA